jgi:transmembrane sensor
MVREALTSEWLQSMDAAEAAALFVSRQAEGLTQSEQQLLESWLAEDDGNAREFERAERAWSSFDEAGEDEILSAMRRHALRHSPRQPAWYRAAAAAMVAVLIGIGFLVLPNFNSTPGPNNVGPAGAPIQYASARGEVKEVRLADGSIMTLDADSLAVGRFDQDRRTIELERGRAFFAVARDTSRPFAVRALGQQVTAVGTQFDVRILGDKLTVTLLEGRVTVGPAGSTQGARTLEPGQQLVIRGGKGLVRRLEERSAAAASWREGLLSFDDQPLGEAAAIVNRYSDDQVVIRDPAVAALRVSGQFRAGDVSRFAETAAELHRLDAVRTGDRIELQQ